MSLYQNKYRIESARLKNWDYSNPGFYFITVCTYDRKYLFGCIKDRIMNINEYGSIVEKEWKLTGEKNPFIILDSFIVMPNHYHGIIQILPDNSDGGGGGRDVMHNVSMDTPNKNEKMASISPRKNSLSIIMRYLNASITRGINRIRNTPGAKVLQPRYHDHVIRNPEELCRIRQYIQNNPANWHKDTFYNNYPNVIRENTDEYEKEIWMI
jgi:REP element-mobilizing transposase RayT